MTAGLEIDSHASMVQISWTSTQHRHGLTSKRHSLYLDTPFHPLDQDHPLMRKDSIARPDVNLQKTGFE